MPILTSTLGLLTSPSSSSSSPSSPACFSNYSLTSNLIPKTLYCHRFPLNKRTFSFYSASSKVSASVSVSVSGNAQTETSEQESGTTNGALADSSPSTEAIRQARRSADWKAARAYHERELIYDGRIEGFNGGGLLVRFYSLVGFLPFPQLSPSHSYKETQKNIQEVAKGLVGSTIPMKVILADEGNRKLIFSEKEAVWSKFSKQVKIGDVFEGKVVSVEDYGAFVDLRFPDGLYHLTGLVHVSEVSWDLVQEVRDILNEGDEVRVKVINVDKERSRITLSIKQLEDDPLLETLDKVIPQHFGLVKTLSQNDSASSDSYDMSHTSSIEPLPGLTTILDELLQEKGINSVRINRQGFEKRVVSQDLQLWLSNAPPIDKKFILLARAGRQVQEIQLTTSLDQEGIKKALQQVLERIP